jgi:type VII secretion-associated serine protease mycosin
VAMLTRLPAALAAMTLLWWAPVGAPVWADEIARADRVRQEIMPVLALLDVPDAWKVTRGRGVTVAVLDSGVDPDQADLAGSVITGPDYTRGANPPGVAPKRLHGTNMASIIAGHGHGPGDGEGVVGVAPEVRLLALRVIMETDEPGYAFFESNERFADTIPSGIRYAADHGADVINLSLGRESPSKEERRAILHALDKNAVVVAAAGNEGASAKARRSGHAPYSYPASYPGVISVAAVNASGRHVGFSNRNSAVVVSAPGVRIVGAGPGDGYWVGDGTSPATAFVSGVAALIRSRYPGLAPALVGQAIVASTTHRPAGGYDPGVGFGQVNAMAALKEAGRLAGARTEGLGLPADRWFDDAPPGPVEVVHHDPGLLWTSGLLGAAGTALMVGGAMAAVRRRRAIDTEP